MSMQTKVTFIEKFPNRGEVQKEILLVPQGLPLEIQFQVKEYYTLFVRFESDDENARLYIDRIDTDSEDQLVVLPGHEVEILSGKDSDDMLVPGDYPITVVTRNQTYQAVYRILPHNLSWTALQNLRLTLENILIGLSYNLLQRRTGTYSNAPDLLGNSPFLTYQNIEKQYKKIRNVLETIIRDPITNISKDYRERIGSRKADPKSLRWLAKKGASKNGNAVGPTYVYEKHAVLNMDTIENRWVKRILRFIQHSLRQLELRFMASIRADEERINKKTIQLLEVKTSYQRRLPHYFGFEKTLKKLRERIVSLEREIANLKEGLQKKQETRIKLTQMITTFSHYEQVSWIQNLSPHLKSNKPTLRLLRDRRYADLYRFYTKELRMVKKKEYSNKKYTFPYKRTSKLFEYYTLTLLIKILEDQGFDWAKGWIADSNDPFSIIGELPSDTKLIFQKDGYYIELVYDHEIVNPRDKSYSHFTANTHNKPDFRMSLFKDSGEFVKTIIIESKCRSKNYLYNEEFETDVLSQCKDYLNIRYYDKDKDCLISDATEKVIVVYPKQSGPIVHQEYYGKVVFVQVEPSDPNEDETPYGLLELQDQLFELIKYTVNEVKVT
jgi:hypothetical protein